MDTSNSNEERNGCLPVSPLNSIEIQWFINDIVDEILKLNGRFVKIRDYLGDKENPVYIASVKTVAFYISLICRIPETEVLFTEVTKMSIQEGKKVHSKVLEIGFEKSDNQDLKCVVKELKMFFEKVYFITN